MLPIHTTWERKCRQMPTDERVRDRERDLVLSPTEFCFIQDQTKGHIDVYTGPFKTSLAGTDQPVVFSEKSKKFERRSLEEAVTTFVTAPEGYYVALKNTERAQGKHPAVGTRNTTPELNVGRKINIPGPVSFALWPGQMIKVLKGHNLRSNQYLLVRVYDEEAARQNWKNAVVKPQVATAQVSEVTEMPLSSDPTPDIVMGKLFVIKGTDVSFYIPPTGVEVVADNDSPGKFLVREAVTLERLEYCLLLDQDGNKRYVQGPAVVFPKPTEEFVTKNVSKKENERVNIRKFKAIELSETSGIYIKVIADYTDEAGKTHKQGDELFITGSDQMIYFPREEHAIIKYGSQEIHYAIAIPAGEARYVLNRNTGVIRLVKGPVVFLPDPRNEVIVHRILDPKVCQLMFPENNDAFQHNAQLLGLSAEENELLDGVNFADTAMATNGTSGVAASMVSKGYMLRDAESSTKNVNLKSAASRGFSGDAFERQNKYTKPRSVTLNTKYDGAVTMDIWTGYAVKLVKKTGESRIISGPQTVVLEYDETPQIISLSRGKPKQSEHRLSTVYLRVTANKVSDIVNIETKDLCRMSIELSYRLNFDDDNKKWFDVEDYVKYLTDHMRSKIRNAVMSTGVEQFYSNSTDIIRDVVLGKSIDGSRTGCTFEENGMHIYDVEVLSVKMNDADVEKAIVSAQRDVIGQTLVLAAQRRSLEHAKEIELLKQARMEYEQATRAKDIEIKSIDLAAKTQFDLATIASSSKSALAKAQADLESTTAQNDIETKKLEAYRAEKEMKLDLEDRLAKQRLSDLSAQVDAVVRKAAAITPDLIAALQAFGDKELLQKLADSMGVMSIVGGESVVDVLKKLLDGTKIAEALSTLKK